MSPHAVASGPVTALLRALVDDAAIFPPGNAPMEAAVSGHARHRAAWYAPVVGPLLCAAGRVAELRAVLDGQPAADGPLDVALVARGLDGLEGAVAAVEGDARLRLAGVEVAPSYGTDARVGARAAAARTAALAPGVRLAVEVPRGAACEPVLDVLAAAGRVRAKLRTGGSEAAAFPGEDEVALFVHGCARRGLAFKCTAGLHHAVRHTDAGTGFEHHGYLNLLLAAFAAQRGEDAGGVAAVVAERDAARLVEGVRRLTEADAVATRTRFASYGACSVTDPVADAVALGLLSPPDETR